MGGTRRSRLYLLNRSAANPQDVERFQTLIAARTGLLFDDSAKPLLGEILEQRIRARHTRSATEYLRELVTSRQETMELIGSLTVSETYFLRNSDQFRVVKSWLRSDVVQSRTPRRLRILSAGCSSGDEPYSLAMVLRDSLPDIADWDVSIQGVDINPRVLERAEAGRYSPWSLRETPAELRARYFCSEGRQFILDPAVRDMVEFGQANLVDTGASVWQPGHYDLVFCRNVLMYLTLDAAQTVVSNILRSMAPRGLLFLGHAENLRGLSQDFHLRHTHGTFYYEPSGVAAPGVASTRVEPRPPAPAAGDETWRRWFDSIERSTARIAEIANRANGASARPAAGAESAAMVDSRESHSLASATELLRSERFAEALQLLVSLPPASAEDPDTLLLKAILLTSAGDPVSAEGVCDRLLELDELNAGAQYVMALCREHAGEITAAMEHDRTAAYLDPGFAMPRLHLGLLLRKSGDALAARRELESAIGLLTREDPARLVLFSGGFGREGLIELCRGELSRVLA